MFRAASEGSQTVSGTFAILVIACVIWAANRHDRLKKEKALAKRKAEIDAEMKARLKAHPEDGPLIKAALDEIGPDDLKGTT